VVNQPQLAVLHEWSASVAGRVKETAIGAVHDHTDAIRGDTAADGELAERLVNRNQMVGGAGGSPGGQRDQRQQRPEVGRRKAISKELGHVFVKVEHHRNTPHAFR